MSIGNVVYVADHLDTDLWLSVDPNYLALITSSMCMFLMGTTTTTTCIYIYTHSLHIAAQVIYSVPSGLLPPTTSFALQKLRVVYSWGVGRRAILSWSGLWRFGPLQT